MRIHTKTVSEWSEDLERYIVVYEEGYDYDGPVDLAKGPSASQQELAQSQSNFYNTLSNDYGTSFGESQGILNSLTSSLQPILNAGPNQNGYTPAETNALNSQAIQGTAQQYASAERALNENQAGSSGDQLLPSGVKSQQQEQLASSGANQTSSQLLGIKNAGYQQGASNFQSAVGQLEGEAGLINPTGVANSATGAGTTAYNSAQTNQQMANQGSIWNTLGGVIGGGVSAALGNPAGLSGVFSSLGGAGGGSGGGGVSTDLTGIPGF